MNLLEWARQRLGMLALVTGALLAGIGFGQCYGCGASHMTAQDSLHVGAEWEDERGCIYAHLDGGRPAVDLCRAAVRAKWDGYWTAYFADGGAR